MAKLNLTALKKQNLSQIVETPPEKIVPSEPESFRAKVSLTQFKREREVKETPSVGTISPVTALSEESISKETTSDITTNEKGANSDIPETPVSVSLEIPNNTPSSKEVLPTREFFPNLAVAQDDMFKDLAGDILN